MPARLTALLIIAVAALAAPAAASASPSAGNLVPANKLLYVQQGSALGEVQSMSSVPLGFTASAGQAVLAAEHSKTMQALHRRIHPLHVYPYVWRSEHPYWYVYFTHESKIVATADVSPAGKVTGVWTGSEAIASYAHGGWAWSVTSWWIFVPAALLFMLVFFDPRRLWRMAHLDALAILGFLASYFLLADQHLYAAVWLAYPPLIYLLVRLFALGFGRGSSRGRLAPLLSTRTLLVGLPLILAARIVLSLVGQQEIDVGYESVIGAFRILHHLPIYYNDPNHGDTYGPITYLVYVPFELIFPWKNSLSNLDAANLAAIVFDLGTIAGLFLLGRRLRGGPEGTRLGLVLAWAWAACPFTIISLTVHTNDGLISMLTVFAVVLFTRPLASGALLGLAAAAKFSPAGLLPLLAAPRQRGWKGALSCVLVFAAVVALAIYAWLPPQGFAYFWQRTIHFQMIRADVFSPWALHPSLHPLQTALEVLAVLVAGAVAFVPRQRSLVQLCALAGAVTIAIQLPATHWYYYYIMWFLPFALVAFAARPALAPAPATEAARREWTIQPAEHEPAMAGA
ncbi:MAG TPA: glycosyltransferase 87 family protein [Solirubrobacteraceae bacterium]|nr:glycosyltransferase 87 family protein [Solirubrobacteraceae bacterium]